MLIQFPCKLCNSLLLVVISHSVPILHLMLFIQWPGRQYIGQSSNTSIDALMAMLSVHSFYSVI
jgi:hypothetical protein